MTISGIAARLQRDHQQRGRRGLPWVPATATHRRSSGAAVRRRTSLPLSRAAGAARQRSSSRRAASVGSPTPAGSAPRCSRSAISWMRAPSCSGPRWTARPMRPFAPEYKMPTTRWPSRSTRSAATGRKAGSCSSRVPLTMRTLATIALQPGRRTSSHRRAARGCISCASRPVSSPAAHASRYANLFRTIGGTARVGSAVPSVIGAPRPLWIAN